MPKRTDIKSILIIGAGLCQFRGVFYMTKPPSDRQNHSLRR
ncbi:hypothetical protein [Moraxella nonliquefaciens]|nr:hypothetical protein [Moraxella nonliquefaciens]